MSLCMTRTQTEQAMISNAVLIAVIKLFVLLLDKYFEY